MDSSTNALSPPRDDVLPFVTLATPVHAGSLDDSNYKRRKLQQDNASSGDAPLCFSITGPLDTSTFGPTNVVNETRVWGISSPSSALRVERHGLQSTAPNKSEMNSVSPPPRDDVPPFETGSNLAFVESITNIGHSAHINVSVFLGMEAPNTLGSSNTLLSGPLASSTLLPSGRPPEPTQG